MRKACFFVVWLLLAGSALLAQRSAEGEITLEKLWARYEYVPAFPQEFTWMKDDQYYSVLENGGIWR